MHLFRPWNFVLLRVLQSSLSGRKEPDSGGKLLETFCKHLHMVVHHGLQAFIQWVSPQKFSARLKRQAGTICLHRSKPAKQPCLQASEMVSAPIFSSLFALLLAKLVNLFLVRVLMVQRRFAIFLALQQLLRMLSLRRSQMELTLNFGQLCGCLSFPCGQACSPGGGFYLGAL